LRRLKRIQKFSPQRCPQECFPKPRCGSQRACCEIPSTFPLIAVQFSSGCKFPIFTKGKLSPCSFYLPSWSICCFPGCGRCSPVISSKISVSVGGSCIWRLLIELLTDPTSVHRFHERILFWSGIVGPVFVGLCFRCQDFNLINTTACVCRLCGTLVIVKVSTERRNWTELNWHGLVFDELTNGQAVMHYRGTIYVLTASVTTWLCAHNDVHVGVIQWPVGWPWIPDCPLVSSSNTELYQFSYLRCSVHLYFYFASLWPMTLGFQFILWQFSSLWWLYAVFFLDV